MTLQNQNEQLQQKIHSPLVSRIVNAVNLYFSNVAGTTCCMERIHLSYVRVHLSLISASNYCTAATQSACIPEQASRQEQKKTFCQYFPRMFVQALLQKLPGGVLHAGCVCNLFVCPVQINLPVGRYLYFRCHFEFIPWEDVIFLNENKQTIRV